MSLTLHKNPAYSWVDLALWKGHRGISSLKLKLTREINSHEWSPAKLAHDDDVPACPVVI